jgi:flagellar biosynthesis protein FlhF
MRVKKYTASTIKEALAQIRREMGETALIISTREMTGSLGRRFVEVTAAADDSPAGKKEERSARALQPSDFEEQIIKNRMLLSQSIEPLKQELFAIRSLVDEMRRNNAGPTLEPLREEMRDLKRLFSALSRQAGLAPGLELSEPFLSFYHDLVANELEESLSYRLIEMLGGRLSDAEKSDGAKARERLVELIAGVIPFTKPIALNGGRPSVLAFIGPTGVGKTTTIAKLAARCSLQLKRKVCLITIDTYRIAAVEQLKTYARIMNIPIFVSYSPEEMRQAIADNREASLILIDTAGRSQADEEQVKDLKGYFSGDAVIEVMLVLSATTKNRDLHDITDRFTPIGPRKLIFTKLDETTTYGPIVNETVRTKLPIAYFTTGQNVPDDIEAASPGKLARMLLGVA